MKMFQISRPCVKKPLKSEGGGLRPPPFRGAVVVAHSSLPLPPPPSPSPSPPPKKERGKGGWGRRGRGRRGRNDFDFESEISPPYSTKFFEVENSPPGNVFQQVRTCSNMSQQVLTCSNGF